MSDYESKVKISVDDSELSNAEKRIKNLKDKKIKAKIKVNDSDLDSAVKKVEKIQGKKINVNTKVSGQKNVDGLSQSFNNATKSANGLTNSFKSFARLGAYVNTFYMIERGARKAVDAIQDIDSAIVDLQMATGDSYQSVRQLVSGYNDLAKQLGATTTEMTSGASDWLRQGKSISETNKLLQDSMVLSKVANISSEDSTSYLTAMINGYKKSVDEVEQINDSLTSIDLAAAVSSAGLAEASSRVSAIASNAGVELNKLLGYEAAMGEATQEDMSVIGNGLKTIFSRMSDIKDGKLELVDEDGTVETLSNVETVLENIGVPLRNSVNEFREFDDVLDDVAKKWDNLSSVQQAAVSKAFSGQRQANRFQILMENYDKALKYEEIANNSSGTAQKKFEEAYLNSIEAKKKSLQASFEGLSTNLISRDAISGILEATQALVEFLNKTNLLRGALSGLAVGGAMKGFVTLTTSITQAAMKLQNFQQALNLLKAGNIGDDSIKQLSVLVDGLSKSQMKAILSSTQLSTAQRMNILTSARMSEAEATATLSTLGLATAEETATASTISLGTAFKGLLSTLLANPIVLVTAAVTAGVAAWSSYKQSVEETIQSAKDATNAWSEANNTLQEQISKYKELKSQLDSGTLSSSEEYEIKQQILDIQTQITSQYGDQVSGIDMVNGGLQTQLGILQQISAENAKTTLNENQKEYEKAEDEMTKSRSYNLGYVTDAFSLSKNNGEITKFAKELKTLIEQYDELELVSNNKGTHIEFTGDASQAQEVIDDFMNKVKELDSLEGYEDYATSILNQSSESLKNNKEKVLDNYQSSYKTFLQMDMMSKGTGEGSVADTFNKYTEAVEAYNEALASGDSDTINKTRSDFAKLRADVDNIVSDEDTSKFSTLFEDVTDQLNEASVKAYDFNEAISGKAGENNQFKKTSGDIKEASDSLKNLKLDAVDAFNTLSNPPRKKDISLFENLENEKQKISIWELDEYSDDILNQTIQSKFGNVDMDKRTIITWSDELKQTYKSALESWDYDPEIGSIDTVFGLSDRFGEDVLETGVEVAFTPIMNGEILDKNTVYDYINELVGEATVDGKFSEEKLLNLDKQGKQIGDTFISGLIAATDEGLNYENNGNWADVVGRLMHFSGKYGAIALAYDDIEKAATKAGMSTEGFINKLKGSDEVSALAKEWGITADSSEEDLKAFIDMLVDTGVVSGNLGDSLDNTTSSFESYSTSVKKAEENLKNLKDIMSESVSGEGISADNVKAFREMFGDDADKALEKTANGYHLNREALAELQEQYNETTKSKYLSALNDQLTELRNTESKIATAELLGQDTSGLEASRNGILDNISSLQDLQYQYEAATSAYQQWQNAMSGGEEGDMYDSIFGNLKDAKDLYDKGLVGTNKFREFVDLMSNQDLSTASPEEIVAAYESALPKIQRYFTEGQEGTQNFLYDIQSLNSEWAHMNEDGSWDINFGIGNDQEIADALGIDVEAVQAIMRKLHDYGGEINLDKPIASLEKLKEQADSAKQSLNNMGENLNINLDASTLEDVDSQISSVEDYIDKVKNSDIDLNVKTDKLESANDILEYLLTQKQELGKAENVDVSINIDENELKEGYDILNSLKTYLENNQTILVGIDAVVNQAGIDECVAKIEAMTPAMKVALGIQGLSTDEIKSGLLDGSIQIPVSADTTQASNDIDNVKQKEDGIEDKKEITVTAKTAQAENALSTVRNYLSNITSKEVTITVNTVNSNGNGIVDPVTGVINGLNNKGIHGVQGTAHIQGTARAGGNWGNASGGKTLVGELGREIIVNPHTGHWYTVGDNGAEFVEIPKNAIVFNHLQSENLLNNGYITGRGKALASGTAMSGGTIKYNPGGSGSKAFSDAAETVESSANAVSEALDEMCDYYDHVAKKLEMMAKATERAEDAIENMVGLSAKQSQNSIAITKLQEELSFNRQAYNEYMNHAKWFAQNAGIDPTLQAQIQQGSLDISKYDEDTQKKISEYKNWIELAQDVQDTILDLEKKEIELAQERLEYIVDYYDALLEINDSFIEMNDTKQELNDAIGASAVSDEVKSLLNTSLKKQEDSYNKALEQLSEYQSEFNSLVTKGYIKEGSDAYLEAQAKLNELTQQVDETVISLVELKDKIREIDYTKLQQLIDRYDRRTEQLTNAQALAEARDELVGRDELQKQVDELSKGINANYELRDKKLQEQNLYDVTSTRYQDLAKEIADLDNEIYSSLEDIEELKNKIFEAEFFNYDKEQENLKYFISELDDFASLLNEDGFFDKSGGFTDEAYAKISLTADAMAKCKQEIANATEALTKLDQMYKNGLISATEYDERQKDLLDTIRDSVGATEDYKNELLDLYTEQIKKENDALKESISLRQKALKSQKSYWDYADSINSKTKDVDALKAQIAALEGVTSASALATKKKLEAELADAEKSLDDTKRDHSYNLMQDGYDLMSENLDKNLEDLEFSIATSSEKQLSVVQSMLNQMVSSYSDAFSKISSIISNTGFVGTGSFNDTVSNVSTSTGSSSIASGATQNPSTINPSDSASNINTSNIVNGNHGAIETEIGKEPNVDNRLCAELTISKKSVSVQEGSQTSLSVTIRPNDAKNKTVSWKSSNPSIASVSSDGKVTGVKPGTASITVSTTDGSGLMQTCKVTVTKKPEPPKPVKPTQPTQPTNPQGNGVPDVGDKVTFVSGIYHEDSYGNGRWGNWNLGQSVYITSMNPNSPYPIHISTGNRLGNGDRGWLRLDQLRGYRKGSRRIRGNQWAWTQENNKDEVIFRASDGAMLTPLGDGDSIFSNEQVQKLWDWTKGNYDISRFINLNTGSMLGQLPDIVNRNDMSKKVEVNQHFDSLVNVDGNVTKDALPGLEKAIDKMIPKISDKLGIYIRGEMRL